MFVEVKVFEEDREILAEATLGNIFVIRRFDFRKIRNFKGRSLLPASVPLQPVLETLVKLASV